MTTIQFTAKCSDMFGARLREDGKFVGEHNGYVPRFMGLGGDDYVEMEIDIDTGKILDWKKPTKAQLQKTFTVPEGE